MTLGKERIAKEMFEAQHAVPQKETKGTPTQNGLLFAKGQCWRKQLVVDCPPLVVICPKHENELFIAVRDANATCKPGQVYTKLVEEGEIVETPEGETPQARC